MTMDVKIDFDFLRKIASGEIQLAEMKAPMKVAQPIWVDVPDVPVIEEEARAYLGKRCEDFEPECFVCQGWKQFDATGTITFIIERSVLLKG